MLLAIHMFCLKHFNKTIFSGIKSYFKLGNSENSRFKLKMSFDFGIGLYLFIVNKYSIKEIK